MIINSISLLYQLPLIAIIIVILTILYLYLYRNLNYWQKRGISGPKPIPVFGNMHSYYFFKSKPELEVEWYRKYGKFYGIFFGNKPILRVAESESVKQILVKDFHNFRNGIQSQTTHPVLSKVLATAVDDDWKRIRAIITPTFSSAKLKRMYSMIKECSDDLTACLDEYALNGNEIDIKRVFKAYTLDVITKCAFATHINTHKNPDNSFSKNAANFTGYESWKIVLLFLLPSVVSKSTILGKLLGGTILGGGVSNNCHEFFIEFGRYIINQRKQMKASERKFNDFIQLLIDAEINDDSSYETDYTAANHLNEGKEEIEAVIKSLKQNNIKFGDKKMTDNEILAQCFLFFMAGSDTTATTLNFCAYELALHPEIQQKMYEEVMPHFDDRGNIEYETLLKLPYLDAVLTETLRKYPFASKLTRVAMDDVFLGDTGILVPKRTTVEIPIYAIHYDPENYPNPQQFIPERFMPENRSNIKPYTYLPFGTGPRNCVGMRFALLHGKLAMANIIKRFVFIKTSNTPVILKYKKIRLHLQTEKPIIIGVNRR